MSPTIQVHVHNSWAISTRPTHDKPLKSRTSELNLMLSCLGIRHVLTIALFNTQNNIGQSFPLIQMVEKWPLLGIRQQKVVLTDENWHHPCCKLSFLVLINLHAYQSHPLLINWLFFLHVLTILSPDYHAWKYWSHYYKWNTDTFHQILIILNYWIQTINILLYRICRELVIQFITSCTAKGKAGKKFSVVGHCLYSVSVLCSIRQYYKLCECIWLLHAHPYKWM